MATHKLTEAQICKILASHRAWLHAETGGQRADLTDADLTKANLSDANLTGAILIHANLTKANLSDAKLIRANLTEAKLARANLSDAKLIRANLTEAKLARANLSDANLTGAILIHANLTKANLRGAKLPNYQICPPTGAFEAWKKVVGGAIIKLRIPAEAKRNSCLVGRKCRAEFVEVLEGEGKSWTESFAKLKYEPGVIVRPDSYDDDPRVECSHGIHFLVT